LKSIVSGKEKKWKKANHRSEEVKIDYLRKEEKWMKKAMDLRKLKSIV
jgi:hypothetical protein